MPYNYCFNNPIKFIDVRGMFPIDPPGNWRYPLYKTKDAAAFGWSKTFQSLWDYENFEYSAVIYKISIDGDDYFGFTRAVRFESDKLAKNKSPGLDAIGMKYHNSTLTLPKDAEVVGHIHDHYDSNTEAVNRGFSSGNFRSSGDFGLMRDNPDKTFYLLNIDGDLRVKRPGEKSHRGWTIASNFDLKEEYGITTENKRVEGKIPFPNLPSLNGKYPNVMEGIDEYSQIRPVGTFWIIITMQSQATVGSKDDEPNKSKKAKKGF